MGADEGGAEVKSHSWWMMMACLGPLLLIFILPVLGVSGSALLFLFIVGCFAIHLLMMRGHGHGNGGHGKGDHHDQN